MEEFSNDLVTDYINGVPINENLLEKLEDSKDFMSRVFLSSKDPKMYRMYRFCSERLKKDYEFIKKIILRFRTNIPFICQVADDYIEQSQDEISTNELIILMCDYTQNTKVNLKYLLKKESFYNTKRIEIECARAKNQDNELFEGTGMGFYFIYDEFSKSEPILNEFAKKIIDEILDEDRGDIEELLHRRYYNPEQITSAKIEQFMISYISCFDSMLASYLSNHRYLMERFHNQIKRMIKKWNRYEYEEERKRYEELLEKVHTYFTNIENETSFSEIDIIFYIAKELGIAEEIALYQGIGQLLLDDINECQKDGLYKRFITSNIRERIYYNELKKLMKSMIPTVPSMKNNRTM